MQFGKLTINEHGQKRIQDLIEQGLSPQMAAIHVNGRDALWLALRKRQPRTRYTIADMLAYLRPYFPLGTHIAITERGITLSASLDATDVFEIGADWEGIIVGGAWAAFAAEHEGK